jgi:hypothetical protein
MQPMPNSIGRSPAQTILGDRVMESNLFDPIAFRFRTYQENKVALVNITLDQFDPLEVPFQRLHRYTTRCRQEHVGVP